MSGSLLALREIVVNEIGLAPVFVELVSDTNRSQATNIYCD